MTAGSASGDSRRHTGTVVKLLDGFGFLHSSVAPGVDIYFNMSWFRDTPPLQVGDTVTFEYRIYEGREQAHYLRRVGDEGPSAAPESAAGWSDSREPVSGRLLDWAYLRHIPTILDELASLALPERWEFKDTPVDPERPKPILYSYLTQTFRRLVLEGKVAISPDGNFAAFNTGLVDRRYEPIYALFRAQDHPRIPWQLIGFCIPGEGTNGQLLTRYFNPRPERAHYFDDPADLLYDARQGEPDVDWKHVVIQRIGRYPAEFLNEHWPPGFPRRDTGAMTPEERKEYFGALGEAIEGDYALYKRIMNRVRDAVELCVKRVSWNFKTAVPQYYPTVRKLQLLLPLCLMDDGVVDLALAVERTPSGNYLAHTVLPLNWAYNNARLICRPDSDWLSPETIIDQGASDEDEEAE